MALSPGQGMNTPLPHLESDEGVSPLEWAIDRNVVSSLTFQGKQLILPWGVETADSSAFFSMEEGIGYRHEIIAKEEIRTKSSRKTRIQCRMQEGRWSLEVDERIEGDTIVRRAWLTCLEDTWFLDFVLRFRFLKEHLSTAIIDGKRIPHLDSNIYHQHPVDHVELRGADLGASLHVVDKTHPASMTPLMYARDRGDEWIVHARFLPQAGREVIKICNGWAGTRPLPDTMSRLFLRFGLVRRSLLYKSERKPARSLLNRILNLNAYHLVKLERGQELGWEVETRIFKQGDST